MLSLSPVHRYVLKAENGEELEEWFAPCKSIGASLPMMGVFRQDKDFKSKDPKELRLDLEDTMKKDEMKLGRRRSSTMAASVDVGALPPVSSRLGVPLQLRRAHRALASRLLHKTKN